MFLQQYVDKNKNYEHRLPIGLQDDCGTSGWPKHGNVSQISDSIAKYTCEEGHVIVGNNTRLCTEGKWSGYVPLCSK